MSDVFRAGPLRISRVGWDWWGAYVTSKDDGARPMLIIILASLWIEIHLPKWALEPHRRKVFAASWDAATVARMGRDWYYEETRREFGLYFYRDSFTLKYGVQPDVWPGNKSKSWAPPWTKWRYLGVSYYGLDGKVDTSLYPDPHMGFEERKKLEALMPTASFKAKDFDGTDLIGTVRLEESEYACGEGRWWWIGMLRRNRFHYRSNIAFDKETGPEKGSWKGGMYSTNGPAVRGELHEATFRRFCEKHRMTFVGHL